jgi:hypothetical protein
MDTTASLSVQFATSVCNPLNIDGYATEPYAVGAYAKLHDIGIAGTRNQFSHFIFNRIRQQYTCSAPGISTLSNSYSALINRERLIRNQVRFTKYVDSPLRMGYFFQSSVFYIHRGLGYCKESWPSFTWSFISVYGSKFLSQTSFSIVKSTALGSQFTLAVEETSLVGNQVELTPIARYRLYSSFYMPCVDEIVSGRPSIYSQINILRTSKIYNEVRWRPF